MNKDIKGIAFDFYGVFVKMKFPVDEYLRKNNIDPERYNDEIYKLVIETDLAKLDIHEFLEKCSKIVGIDLPYNECRSVYRKDLINASLVSLVKELKSKYKIALITNNNFDCINAYIHNSELGDLFDYIVTSYQVGHRKPAPEIYQAILKKMRLNPKELLFVDDDPRNIPEAKRQGIVTLLYEWGKDKELLKLL